jgi:hypothetical protein
MNITGEIIEITDEVARSELKQGNFIFAKFLDIEEGFMISISPNFLVAQTGDPAAIVDEFKRGYGRVVFYKNKIKEK